MYRFIIDENTETIIAVIKATFGKGEDEYHFMPNCTCLCRDNIINVLLHLLT